MFYERPARLDRRKHAKLKLRGDLGFAFARGVNSVMLLGAEFVEAQRHYPIVFIATADGRFFPTALLGVRSGENLFVDGQGRWAAGAYVPAYVRRYPFVITAGMDVCIDEASAALDREVGEPLFLDDGADATSLTQAATFLGAFHAEVRRTHALCDALRDLGLLTPWRVEVTPRAGPALHLDGLYVVDETRAAELPDETIGAWFRSGDLARLQAHLVSLQNLAAVAARLPASWLADDAGPALAGTAAVSAAAVDTSFRDASQPLV